MCPDQCKRDLSVDLTRGAACSQLEIIWIYLSHFVGLFDQFTPYWLNISGDPAGIVIFTSLFGYLSELVKAFVRTFDIIHLILISSTLLLKFMHYPKIGPKIEVVSNVGVFDPIGKPYGGIES